MLPSENHWLVRHWIHHEGNLSNFPMVTLSKFKLTCSKKHFVVLFAITCMPILCPVLPHQCPLPFPSFILVFCLQANNTCSLAVVAYSTDVQSQNTHKYSHWNFLNFFPEQEAKILQCPVTSQTAGQSGITGSSTVSFVPHSPSSSGYSESELLVTVLGQKPDETDQVTYHSPS